MHPLGEFGFNDPAHADDPPIAGPGHTFTGRLHDRNITSEIKPYRSDSFILISAGADGIYGTEDDITNWQVVTRAPELTRG